MTAEDKEDIAELIAHKLAGKQLQVCHAFTSEEAHAVKDLVKTKNNAVKTMGGLLVVMVLWVLKDLYFFLTTHIAFNWPGK